MKKVSVFVSVIILLFSFFSISAFADNTANLYTVENELFKIHADATNAEETTAGINAAISWAKENGYDGIRLSDGTYLISCPWQNPSVAPYGGINPQNDTVLDLGSAVLKIAPNSQPAYGIIICSGVQNVIITGGSIIGDKEAHDYTSDNNYPTHEWGSGIIVANCKNVRIENMKTSETTGDAITLRGLKNENSDNVTVTGCELFSCRRQGISITGCVNAVIENNRIYSISGTDPQFGIDVEVNAGYSAAGTIIRNNTISDCTGGSVFCCNSENYTVTGNTFINGGVHIAKADSVTVNNNTLTNSQIYVDKTAANFTVDNNSLDATSKITIEGSTPTEKSAFQKFIDMIIAFFKKLFSLFS